MCRHPVSNADHDSGLVQILTLLQGEILLYKRLVELAEAFGGLVDSLWILNNIGCPLVFEIKFRYVILLTQEVQKGVLISCEFDSQTMKRVFTIPGFHQSVTKLIHYTHLVDLQAFADG